uniref:HTH CENPB-type domain-containing protein n=1 Tax=Trichuris muris TaxID=70415 RepID=A0A5S6QNE3_TRIMR
MKEGGLRLQSLTEDVDSGMKAAAKLWFSQYRRNRLALRRGVAHLIERATCHASGHHEFVKACSNLWISDHRMTQRRPSVIEQKQVNRMSFIDLVNTSVGSPNP